MRFSVILSLFLTLNCSPMTSKTLPQTKTRDLSRYERAGPFTVGLGLDAQSRAAIQAEIRTFLWQHWHQLQLGHIVATFYSREGEPSTSTYFVEPDEKGIWRIAVEIDRTLVDRGGAKSRYQESVKYNAYSVERVEVSKDELTRRTVISEGEARSPQSYRLVLRDETGKALAEI